MKWLNGTAYYISIAVAITAGIVNTNITEPEPTQLNSQQKIHQPAAIVEERNEFIQKGYTRGRIEARDLLHIPEDKFTNQADVEDLLKRMN